MSQWPVPQPWFPALLRKSRPQQSWSGVAPLPVGHRRDELLFRENKMAGASIGTHVGNGIQLLPRLRLLQGSKFLCGSCISAVEEKA